MLNDRVAVHVLHLVYQEQSQGIDFGSFTRHLHPQVIADHSSVKGDGSVLATGGAFLVDPGIGNLTGVVMLILKSQNIQIRILTRMDFSYRIGEEHMG